MGLREKMRKRRHRRVRKKVRGTAARPRMVVSRSLRHISVQIVDDDRGCTLVTASSCCGELNAKGGGGGNVKAAGAVGKLIAGKALKASVESVVFDRGGYLYHGRVKALAEAAREGGLKF